MKKRILSLFLSLSMIVGLIAVPNVAFATADDVIKGIGVSGSGGSFTLTFTWDESEAPEGEEYWIGIWDKKTLDSKNNQIGDYDVAQTEEDAIFYVHEDINYETPPSLAVNIDSSSYQPSGNTYYIKYACQSNSDGAQQSVATFELDSNGNKVVAVDKIKVPIDANNGSLPTGVTSPIEIELKNYTADELKSAINVTPTRTGYSFLGWSKTNGDNASADRAAITDSANYSNGGTYSDTLYAVWQEKRTLDKDDFNTATALADKTYTGSAITIATTAITAKNDTAKNPAGTAATDGVTVSKVEYEDQSATAGTYLNSINAPGTYNVYIDTAAETTNYKQATRLKVGELTVSLPEVTAGISATGGVYKGSAYSATVTGLGDYTAGTDYTVTYTGRDGTVYNGGTATATAPTDVGKYTATLALTTTGEGKVSLGSGSTTTADFEITAKDVKPVKKSDVEITKPYDGGTSVKKKEVSGDNTTYSALAVGDLELDGVVSTDASNVSLGGTLNAAYEDANASSSDKDITISSGLSLSGTKAGNYNLDVSDGLKGKITAKPVTAAWDTGKGTKVYGETGLINASDLVITGLESGDNLGITSVTSDGTAANATVTEQGYDITITKSNTNYDITTKPKYTVTKRPVTLALAKKATAPTYKGSEYNASDLADVTVTNGDGTADTWPTGLTASSVATEITKVNNSDVLKNAAENYQLKADLTEAAKVNFSATAVTINDGKIAKATYKALAGPADKINVAVGASLFNQTASGTLEGVVEADNLAGTYTTTEGGSYSTGATAADENHDYPGVYWTFALNNGVSYDTTNYEEPVANDLKNGSSNTATIHSGSLSDVNITAVAGGGTYGDVTAASITTSETVTYTTEYQTNGTGAWSTTPPTDAGNHKVRYTLTTSGKKWGTVVSGVTKDSDTVASANYTINPKAVTVDWASGKGSKKYGQTETVDSSYLTFTGATATDLATLTITVASSADTTANIAPGTYNVTVATDNTNYSLPATPLTYTVNKMPVTATIKSATDTKTYGTDGSTELAVGNFDYVAEDNTVTVTSADITGITFTSEQGTPATAAVDTTTGYAITATGTNANYTVTTSSKLKVKKADITITADGKTTDYIGSKPADSALVDASTDAAAAIAPTLTYTYSQSSSTVTPVNAGTYSVTVDLSAADKDNFNATPVTKDNVVISAVNPQNPTTAQLTASARQDDDLTNIKTQNITVNGVTVNGTPESVAGTLTITPTTDPMGDATQENLPWTFTPTSSNYKPISGNDAIINLTTKNPNPNTPSVKGVAPTEIGGNGSIEITRLATDTDDTAIQYKLATAADTEWETKKLSELTKDTITDLPVGEYVVRYAETDEYDVSENAPVTVPEETTYKITATALADDAKGTYTYTVNGSDKQSGEATDKVIAGKSVKITATPDKGYTAKISVTKDGLTSGNKVTVSNSTFTMPENDVTITVTFSKQSTGGGGGGGSSSYSVTFDPADNGTITSGKNKVSVSYNASVPSSSVPTVTANEGYTFVGWTQDGETVVNPATVNIKKSTTFTALYKEGDAEPTPTPTLTPIPDGDTAYHEHYISGYEDGSFRADGNITRAEVATIFALALTDYNPNAVYDNPYEDVPDDEWYVNYVSYLASTGVITGYEDGTFRPQNRITRQEFATMIARLGEVLPAGEMPFGDVSEENWGVDYIYTTYANGWVAGYEDGTFRPENQITRAEAVKIVNGYLGRNVDASSVDHVEYNKFYDVSESHWAYYEIIEASNDHDYLVETAPEIWTEVK